MNQEQFDTAMGLDRLKTDPLGQMALKLARCCSYENGPELNALRMLDTLRSEIARLKSERDELREALIDVLNTGLNGGNNIRLAYIAASQQALGEKEKQDAEASERAVIKARALLSKGKENK